MRPGEAELWSVCARTLSIHRLARPDFAELAALGLPAKGYWISFSPDGRYGVVALAGADAVAVIDAEERALLRTIAVGPGPKRNLVLPDLAAAAAGGG